MRRRMTTLAMVGAMVVVTMATPALADNAIVTQGSFSTFPDGNTLGYDIAGRATMIRTASDQTVVVVAVSGLVPGLTYGSHVHKQACSDGLAGGHYSFGFSVPGGALDGSEIWPGPFTANPAGRAVGWVSVGATAGPDALSVVIHAPGGAKIACADLR